MRKALLYYNKFEDIIRDMLTQTPREVLEELDAVVVKSIENKDFQIEPLKEEILKNAISYIKKTQKQREDMLKNMTLQEKILVIFPAVYALTKAYLIHSKSTDKLFFNSNIPYKTFAAQAAQDLFGISPHDILENFQNHVRYALACDKIGYRL